MLFRAKDLEAIAAGRSTLAFRRWKKPSVRAGGSVRTALGLVGIDTIEPIAPEAVTDAEAREAGYRDAAGVLAMFSAQQGTCYRIRLHWVGGDPRHLLADALPSPAELAGLRRRLDRLDGDSPWTRQVLALIADRPGVVSTQLAAAAGLPRDVFKLRVRRLKALGLTESLAVGYRLSPRGVAQLAAL